MNRVTVTFEPIPGFGSAPTAIRVRRMLKLAKRYMGLRAVDVVEAPRAERPTARATTRNGGATAFPDGGNIDTQASPPDALRAESGGTAAQSWQ
jgi:hypothetical protein